MLQQVRIIWVGIFTSTVAMFAVGSILQPYDLTLSQTYLAIYGVVAIVISIVGAIFVRLSYRSALRGLKLSVREEPTSGEPSEGYRGASLSRKVIRDADAATRVARVFQVSTIMGLALGEVPALLGLVARSQGAGMPVGLAFTLVSWIAIGARFPTLARAYGPVAEVYGASMPD